MNLVTMTFNADEWQLVPKKATAEMLFKAHMQIDFDRSDQNTYEMAHKSQVGSTIEEDMADAYAALLTAAPQPPAVSAEPVACPYPCGWRELHRIIVESGAYLACGLVEDGPVTGRQREETMRMIGYARDLCLMGVKLSQPSAGARRTARRAPRFRGGFC